MDRIKNQDDLFIANKQLIFQNEEKEKRASELVIANKELAFQNDEKEKRAAELIIANIELLFQNEEKENRAAELVIANKELVFQNEEKEKRAAELGIANKELAFLNEEKEHRAAELIIANKELLFQNDEKEKRAAELIIANTELAFQNKEKEDRAAELIIANQELLFQNEEKEKRAIELTIANNELESFSYSVSHDLRAPIRAISSYSKIISEEYAGNFDPEGLKMLHSILNNSKKMGALIDNLLSFSRLGRKALTISDTNMTNIVNSVRDEVVKESGGEANFIINTLLPSKADHALIRQVWINLISNALKYSRNKPVINIEIGSYEKDSFVIYYIKDNGAGFDMEYYDKLFGVFQRLHSDKEFEGTGIGLANVQRIIHRHKGTIWAESKVNEGACFYFSLQGINSNSKKHEL
jgi:signal transduction histidine kinase